MIVVGGDYFSEADIWQHMNLHYVWVGELWFVRGNTGIYCTVISGNVFLSRGNLFLGPGEPTFSRYRYVLLMKARAP